jgi:replicative DNA helicase Mcm
MINLGAPSKSQQQVREYIKKCVDELAHEGGDDGAKRADILERASERGGYDKDRVDKEIDKLSTKGDLYDPQEGYWRTT